jgi:predicted glycogen debranching enzyme
MNFKKKRVEDLNQKEWLYTNGLGGYASSSVTGCNTRRYHGLLVASFNPPTDRRVLVSKVQETLVDSSGVILELSTNYYTGAIHPQGFNYLTSFRQTPFPKAIYETPNSVLTKSVFMVQGSNTTVVEYTNQGKEAFGLKVIVFPSNRDYHSLLKENDKYDFWTEDHGAYQKIHACYGSEALYVHQGKGKWQAKNNWYYNIEYPRELERGLDFNEDYFAAGEIIYQLEPGEMAHIIFSTDAEMMKVDGNTLRGKELENIHLAAANTGDPFLDDLIRSGNQFIVHRKSTQSASIIAGYPWFTDWGRDTMIAIRGLCISRGRKDLAECIIKTFLQYLDDGMLPNRFPDSGEAPEYNTIDATMWLFIVLFDYYKRFNDLDFIKGVFPLLSAIISAHIKGTRYAIHINQEGLLQGGEDNMQLTWMDARVNDHVVTPRHGCPVEVNMLWYNALKIHANFAEELKTNDTFSDYIMLFENNFRKYFLHSKGYLYDVVIPNVCADESIRPNMIYAVSLPFTVLTLTEQQEIVNTVQHQLFTPYGLNTLEPGRPDFKPAYEGGVWQRDMAYHQGTTWPFLLGEFFEAYLKINKFSKDAADQVFQWVKPLKDHFYHDNCLHGISEIFDGIDPKSGKGTINQAWSVSALIKTLTDMKSLTI